MSNIENDNAISLQSVSNVGLQSSNDNDLKSSSNHDAEIDRNMLSSVIEIANMINSQIDLDRILATISVEFSKILDFDLGCVATYEKNDNCLYIQHVFRRNGDSRGEGRYVPFEDSNLVGWVAINKEPILRVDISNDKRFEEEIMKEDNLGSDIVIPLLSKGVLIGTFNVGSLSPHRYDEADLNLVKDFGSLICLAIEKTQTLQKLKHLGEKYHTLMKSTNDIIMILNTSGEIVECNEAISRIFGYSREELTGRSLATFAPPERRETVSLNFGEIMRGKTMHLQEASYITKSEEIVYLDINASLINIKNHPYVLGVGHDVTDRKRLKEKITIQNRELKENNRKLKKVDQLKSEFLGRISHELRTPLSVIMAYTGSLIDDRDETIDKATKEEFLNVIADQSDKLLTLINDLLDLSKVEISETMLDVTESSINEMINASVAIVSPFALQREVEVKVMLCDSIPVARFDPLRIRQICVNLLSNAIKFTPRGDAVEISTSLNKDMITVSVKDRGPGIESGDVTDIFEHFTQVDGGSARSKNGMGIGLRLVKHYVELHRGRIWVESVKGEGSTFKFTLPLIVSRI
ncbi:MAG: PAS domain S-box protein [Candidatus Krumholzibacteria bacterium]|nr:PAS domain S-box protein [Candidatus Krumholzibacteria bacterium]